MLSLSPATRIFVALQPVDMRAGLNRLYAHVETRLNQDPPSGHLFVFTNRLRNRVKILYFDGSGLWVCAKRLVPAFQPGSGGQKSQRTRWFGRLATVENV
jgi:transposase